MPLRSVACWARHALADAHDDSIVKMSSSEQWRTKPLLALRDVKVQYRSGRFGRRETARAVDGVSLDWHPHEVLGLVGESGSGKSTVARTMIGLAAPSSGTVLLDGERPANSRTDLRALRRRVQMIFQDPFQSLDPLQTVRSIISEPLFVAGVSRSERHPRVCSALEAVGLDPVQFLDRMPHELSGGQRQRVAIAASLAMDPDGLICDEPVSMLDVSVQAQVVHVLMRLHTERNLALLFITHDLALAWTVCDRIAVMYLGRIVELGMTEDVIKRPQHPYTRALLDVAPRTKARTRGSRSILAGEVPSAVRIPSGCRFHPRCPVRLDSCANHDPPLAATGANGGGHLAACVLTARPGSEVASDPAPSAADTPRRD